MKCKICGHGLIQAQGMTLCPNALMHPVTQKEIEREARREIRMAKLTANMTPRELEYFQRHYRY